MRVGVRRCVVSSGHRFVVAGTSRTSSGSVRTVESLRRLSNCYALCAHLVAPRWAGFRLDILVGSVHPCTAQVTLISSWWLDVCDRP
jgi:hypothetical protein